MQHKRVLNFESLSNLGRMVERYFNVKLCKLGISTAEIVKQVNQ